MKAIYQLTKKISGKPEFIVINTSEHKEFEENKKNKYYKHIATVDASYILQEMMNQKSLEPLTKYIESWALPF